MTDGAARDRERVAGVWGEAAEGKVSGPPRGWLDSPPLRAEVRRRQTGREDVEWPDALVDDLGLALGGTWLSLGCGLALTEIGCAERGLFSRMDAVDVSERALEAARRAAAERGVATIRFAKADIDPPRLPEAAYDVVVFNMSLHHVRELGPTLGEVHAALRPGGRLLVNEYVGPSQFQFGERQLDLVRRLLAAIPERLRTDLTSGELKTEYTTKPIGHWWSADPSEAVRSDEILPALESRFDLVYRRDYGGSLLALALEHIVHNFREDDLEAATALRLAALLDDVVTHGVLPSDFALLAFARRGEGPFPEVREAIVDPAVRAERDRAQRIATQRDAELERLSAELDLLRAERDAVDEAHRTILASRSWRALEALRGLLGRRWGGKGSNG